LAGAAWLLDYTVAVVLSAWDGVAVSRRRRSRSAGKQPAEDTIEAINGDAASAILRPGRAAASLAVIGAVSISVLGALWSQPAPAESPGLVVHVPRASVAHASVARWSPLVSEESSSDSSLRLLVAGASSSPEAAASSGQEPTPVPVEAAEADTPTPEPTPEATPEPAPPTPDPPQPASPAPIPGAQLTRDAVREIALQVGWPESELDELLDVAWCESRYRVDANGWGALGLMQIMPFWFEVFGVDVSLAFDPATNLQVAYYIYQNDLKNGYSEWASWSCKPLPAS
jgi:hypothetical protein